MCLTRVHKTTIGPGAHGMIRSPIAISYYQLALYTIVTFADNPGGIQLKHSNKQ